MSGWNEGGEKSADATCARGSSPPGSIHHPQRRPRGAGTGQPPGSRQARAGQQSTTRVACRRRWHSRLRGAAWGPRLLPLVCGPHRGSARSAPLGATTMRSAAGDAAATAALAGRPIGSRSGARWRAARRGNGSPSRAERDGECPGPACQLLVQVLLRSSAAAAAPASARARPRVMRKNTCGSARRAAAVAGQGSDSCVGVQVASGALVVGLPKTVRWGCARVPVVRLSPPVGSSTLAWQDVVPLQQDAEGQDYVL